MPKRRNSGMRNRNGPRSAAKPRPAAKSRRKRWRAVLEDLLHVRPSGEPPWKLLPLVLGLAFAARAAVALSGDFVLHPDEIFQFLEPAHRLVFGNGIVPWEYYYGARSWLIPGAVAAILKLFDVAGLGEPFWYIGGVKLVFCALSLAIPSGMYFFARLHFTETAARAALLAGAFWYELVCFAHKPMSEFVATGLLMVLLAVCVQPAPDRARTIWAAALLAVLSAAVRVQYAPFALLLLGIVFLRTEKKLHLTVASAAILLAVGLFDMVTWNLAAGSFGEAAGQRGPFHSYLTNVRLNFAISDGWASESAWNYLMWLLFAGGGLTLICAVLALRELRRYGLLLSLIALVVLLHALQAHKEYRFIFFAVPLWLLIGADLASRFTVAAGGPRLRPVAAAAAVGAISLAGALEWLPNQNRAYQGIYVEPPERLGFIGGNPEFAAFRYLSRAPGVGAVAHVSQQYLGSPGYYYLHRSIPFYDSQTLSLAGEDLQTFAASVSHVVSFDPNIVLPGYSVEEEFGDIRILRRLDNEAPVREWRSYVLIDDSEYARALRRLDRDAAAMPPDSGIRFADRAPPEQF